MRVHPLGDLGLRGGLFDDLLDALGRVLGVLDGFEEVSRGAMAQVGSQLLRQLRQDRHVPALPTLGLGDQDHLFLKEHLVGCDVHELRDARAGLEQRLDEQPSGPLHAVGMGNALALLLPREPCSAPLYTFICLQSRRILSFLQGSYRAFSSRL
jgi:hypothetical protein